MLLPQPAAVFLGSAPPWLVFALGAGLAINGAHLVWAARRISIKPTEVLYFATADLLWVTASLLLVGAEIWITTSYGVVAALVVAACVGTIGLMQVALIARSGAASSLAAPADGDAHLSQSLTTTRAIMVSWLSMKTWVKVWLLAVNAAFVGAIAFWPSPLVKLTLAAYVASGPWLAAIAIAQRGLTRLLGMAHLIPWSPLLAALLAHWFNGAAEPGSSDPVGMREYLLALTACLAVCIVLDVVDVWRWTNGERYRLGSKAAHSAGASRLAAA